ncbi:GNAT family protein [Ferruginibacter paludis]|uniref:GNAT family N-acetyltransferase n=1 Tax=Ferruginibacter paludis TaxID=1310417 RepID=UPI0025B46091|nr:GNAT family protein [Ferruginibacter paludis]MDN3655124.1 GNAT family protein [Ferruginibacter paludis]
MMNPADFFNTEHVLENNRARLEPLQEKHYGLLLPIAMEKVLWQFTSNTILNEADFRKYFDVALAERQSGTAYPFAVYDKLNNCYGGCTRYGNIAFAHKRMEIGWTWYAPNLQGSGINKACKSLLLNFGFDELQLNRIELKTSQLNLKSQAAMLKIGAVKEGILRNHMITDNGTVRNTVYFSFIKEEWPAVKNRYEL